MNFKLKNNKGVTLLEVIISIALIATISIGLFMTIDNTKISNTKNDKDLKAMDIAQSEIEYIIRDIKDGDEKLNLGDKEIKLDEIKSIQNNNESKKLSAKYYKEHGKNDSYEVKVWLGKIKERQQIKREYYIYSVEVGVKSKSDFSKREVKLQTEILQKFK